MRTGHDPRLFSNPYSDETYTAALVKALSQLNPSKANLQILFDIPDEIFKRRVLQALPEKVRAKYMQYLSEDTNLMHRYQQQPFFTLEEKKRLDYVDPNNSLKTKCIEVLSKVVQDNPLESFPALIAISDPFIQQKVLENCQETLVKTLIRDSSFKDIYKQALEDSDAVDKNYNIKPEDKKYGPEKEKNPFVKLWALSEEPIVILKNNISFTVVGKDPKGQYGIYQDEKDENTFVIREKIVKCTKFTDFVPEVTLKDLYVLTIDPENSTVKLFDANDKNQVVSFDKLKGILEPTTYANLSREGSNEEKGNSPAPISHLKYGCHGY